MVIRYSVISKKHGYAAYEILSRVVQTWNLNMKHCYIFNINFHMKLLWFLKKYIKNYQLWIFLRKYKAFKIIRLQLWRECDKEALELLQALAILGTMI